MRAHQLGGCARRAGRATAATRSSSSSSSHIRVELESPPLEATVVTERIRALGRSSAWVPPPLGYTPHPLFLYHRIRFPFLLRSIRFPVGLGFPCETHNSFNVTMTAGVSSLRQAAG